jgi:hypothetical protein
MEADQVLLVYGVNQAARARGCHPAAAEHLKGTAGLQGARGELFFQLGSRERPVSRQTIDDEILEPHGRGAAEKSAQYSS